MINKNEQERQYLPIMLDVTGMKILLIGAGLAMSEKLRSLGQIQKEVTVISPSFQPVFLEHNWLKRIERRYQSGDLEGFNLVYVGVNHPETELQILADARKLNLLINFVDKVEFSDFISPSVLIRQHFAIFVSTYGKGPGATKKIRQLLEEKLDLDEIDRETAEYIRQRQLGRKS